MSDAVDQQPPTAIPRDEDRESNDERYSKLLRQKRSEFLDHLLRSLDMIAYCHFSYLYFLDCSLFRFLIRSAIQLNFLTPKPPNFPVQSQRRPAIVALFGSTAFCFLCHVISTAPSAGELSNGYLHGGLIIDFIGQEGPVSKWRLVFMDTAILALQLVMLTLVVSKQEQDTADTLAEERRTIPPSQDLDSEERGEVRRHSMSSGSSDEVDANAERGRQRNLRRGDEEVEVEVEAEGGGGNETPLVVDPMADEIDEVERDRQRRIFELTSGEFIAAELKVVDVVKKQWRKTSMRAAGSTAVSHTNVEGTRARRRV